MNELHNLQKTEDDSIVDRKTKELLDDLFYEEYNGSTDLE